MEFFAPYAIDDLMHFTRMGSPANVVLPLLMLAAFVGQIFFMLRGGKSSRIVLVKFAFLVLLLSEVGRNLDGGGAFLVIALLEPRPQRRLRTASRRCARSGRTGSCGR